MGTGEAEALNGGAIFDRGEVGEAMALSSGEVVGAMALGRLRNA